MLFYFSTNLQECRQNTTVQNLQCQTELKPMCCHSHFRRTSDGCAAVHHVARCSTRIFLFASQGKKFKKCGRRYYVRKHEHFFERSGLPDPRKPLRLTLEGFRSSNRNDSGLYTASVCFRQRQNCSLSWPEGYYHS